MKLTAVLFSMILSTQVFGKNAPNDLQQAKVRQTCKIKFPVNWFVSSRWNPLSVERIDYLMSEEYELKKNQTIMSRQSKIPQALW